MSTKLCDITWSLTVDAREADTGPGFDSDAFIAGTGESYGPGVIVTCRGCGVVGKALGCGELSVRKALLDLKRWCTCPDKTLADFYTTGTGEDGWLVLGP